MSTIEIIIGKKQIDFPLSWNHLSPFQITMAGMVITETDNWNNLKAPESEKPHIEAQKLGLNLKLAQYLLGISDKLFNKLTPEQQLDLLPLTQWVYKEKYPDCIVIKEFEYKNQRFYTHQEGLKGNSLLWFINAEALLKKATKSAKIHDLEEFLCHICLNAKGEHPVPITFKGLNPYLCHALLLQYLGARKKLMSYFRHVFPDNGQQKKEKTSSGWFPVIANFIAPKFGNDVERAQQANLYAALGVLDIALENNKELQKRYKEATRK